MALFLQVFPPPSGAATCHPQESFFLKASFHQSVFLGPCLPLNVSVKIYQTIFILKDYFQEA